MANFKTLWCLASWSHSKIIWAWKDPCSIVHQSPLPAIYWVSLLVQLPSMSSTFLNEQLRILGSPTFRVLHCNLDFNRSFIRYLCNSLPLAMQTWPQNVTITTAQDSGIHKFCISCVWKNLTWMMLPMTVSSRFSLSHLSHRNPGTLFLNRILN